MRAGVTIRVALHPSPPARSSSPAASAHLQAAVHSAAVADIDDHDTGLVALHVVNDPPRADSDPEQPATTRQGFDLGRRGIISEVQEGTANAVADDRVEGFVLLAGARGQFDLVSGHPLSALGKLSVHVAKLVGAPLVGVPVG
jgi:hypothetical protein